MDTQDLIYKTINEAKAIMDTLTPENQTKALNDIKTINKDYPADGWGINIPLSKQKGELERVNRMLKAVNNYKTNQSTAKGETK